jgi:hypothetical protein
MHQKQPPANVAFASIRPSAGASFFPAEPTGDAISPLIAGSHPISSHPVILRIVISLGGIFSCVGFQIPAARSGI